MGRGRGFTLIELVTVLIIVGILSFFVISRLDFVSTFDQRSYHDKLKAGLQFARRTAVAERRYVCVAVATGVVSFKFDPNVPESVGTPNCSNALSLPTPDRNCAGPNQICLPSGVSLTAPASGTNFTFDARGASSAAAAFSSTGQPNIIVENETGYVH